MVEALRARFAPHRLSDSPEALAASAAEAKALALEESQDRSGPPR